MKQITSLVKGTASFLYRHSRARGNPGFNLLLLLSLATSIAPRYAQGRTIADGLDDWPMSDNARMTALEIRNKTTEIVRTIDAMVDSDCGIFTNCRYVSANGYNQKLNKVSLLEVELEGLCGSRGWNEECVYSNTVGALLRVAEYAPEAGEATTEKIGTVAYNAKGRDFQNKTLQILAKIVFEARPSTETRWGRVKAPWYRPASAAIDYLSRIYFYKQDLNKNQKDFILRILERAADPDIEKSPEIYTRAYEYLGLCVRLNGIPPRLVEKHRRLREQKAGKVQSSVGRYDWQRGNRQ